VECSLRRGTARGSDGLLLAGATSDEAKDQGSDEKDETDDCQPEQSFDRKPDDGQDRPDNQEDHDNGQHADYGTRESAAERWALPAKPMGRAERYAGTLGISGGHDLDAMRKR
jgi:hypothetical protein